MGTVIPPPLEPPDSPPGNPCNVCWGIGKAFGDLDTPQKLTVSISGMYPGPTWHPTRGDGFEGTVELTQHVAQPCNFQGAVPGYTVSWIFSGLDSVCVLVHPMFGTVWRAESANICDTFLLGGFIQEFVGGSVLIVIPGFS